MEKERSGFSPVARQIIDSMLPRSPTIAELTRERRRVALNMMERRAKGERGTYDLDRALLEELSLRIARALARRERGKHDE